MLYYLFRFLEQWGITGSHMWGYISFRALLALILSLVISAWFGEKFIKYLKSKQITETQRDASIDPFGVKKIGVPSMGGVIIILAILVPVLLLGRLRNIYLILMIITTVWLGFLGGMDDFIKIFKRDKEGLKGKYKIIGQIGIGLIVGLVLWSSPDVKMNENLAIEQQGQETVVKHRTEARKSLKTTIPFVKGHNLDYSSITSFCGKYKVAAGWILFVIMTIFVVTAVSNGANLNDGMDGMCAGSILLCLHRSPHRFPLVQCLPCPGIHGRYGFADHRRYHRSRCHHHPQGADAAYPLRYFLRRKPQRDDAGLLLQDRKAERCEAAYLQAHTYPRQLPHTGQPAGS